MNEQNELLTAAMQIILHAGNARNAADEALEEAKRFIFRRLLHIYRKLRKRSHWHISHKRISFKRKPVDMAMNQACYLPMRRIP